MRVAVLSDVHSNIEALDAVLAAADEARCERVIVLGDIVGYGPDPDAVIDRLREREAVAIAGNHDLAAIGAFDVRWFNEVASAAIAWTSETMSPEGKDYLGSLRPTRDTEHGLLVHGSVRDPVAEYVLSAEEATASFDLAGFTVAFFGHTHLPTVFRRRSDGHVTGWVMDEGEEVVLAPGERYMLNPGSVGQPRDRDPRASFLVWEGERAVGHRVVYPIEETARKIRAAGLPEWLAQRLSIGQ
ncbi:MAG: metallophosphoesterase family protein [Actinobacteria bacterium]|nr:MAG: metallophosphoesterase family protein [Actinomycetota bacterium]